MRIESSNLFYLHIYVECIPLLKFWIISELRIFTKYFFLNVTFLFNIAEIDKEGKLIDELLMNIQPFT